VGYGRYCLIGFAGLLALGHGFLSGTQALSQNLFATNPPGNLASYNVRYSAAPLYSADAASQSHSTLVEADRLDRLGIDRCVDFYYRSTWQAAQALEIGTSAVNSGGETAWQTYHVALAGLIQAGQRYGRLDPRGQLIILENGTRNVPVKHFGFAWQPKDFSRLVSADRFQSADISHHYATAGLGHSMVAERVAPGPDEMFFRPRQPFAVTAVLRPVSRERPGESAALAPGATGSDAILELYNPHVFDTVAWGNSTTGLSRDFTAPLAAIVLENPRQYLRGFTAPSDTSVQPQLVMVEPYQRGKIPVVFIHGLYSDPITWVDTANDLRALPDVYRDYQFWTFRYPTGGELLDSVATLRHRLNLAREQFDPRHQDPALDQVVLVGHSLGGLVSKMQTVTSHDLLWRQVAQKPVGAVRASPQVQARLTRDFFFVPVPSVTRVVFIGTPHHGSSFARRFAGRVGSNMVRFGSQEDSEYRELMNANRDVFQPTITRRPTTIDLLEPSSPFLTALEQMPINPPVRLHSIIGTGGNEPFSEPGDGVVTVASARHAGVISEVFVPARHEKLHRHPVAIAELARILREHAAELKRKCVGVPLAGGSPP
jgi:pimeloyl-ACP methyl ester carboxylesterase